MWMFTCGAYKALRKVQGGNILNYILIHYIMNIMNSLYSISNSLYNEYNELYYNSLYNKLFSKRNLAKIFMYLVKREREREKENCLLWVYQLILIYF